MLNGHRTVVEEDYSELGAINPSETFTVSFWIYSIDGKPPSEHVSLIGQWDLLYKVDKRIPRWQSLVLEPTPIRFPRHGERFDMKEASDTLKPMAAVPRTGPRIPPIATSFQTKQSSSMTLNALLILVVFLAVAVTSRCFRRCR